MEQIVVKHRDGTESILQNREGTVKITRAEQRKQLLGEDTLNITIQSAQPIEIFIGDRIEIFGSVYTINQLPTIKKTGTRIFEQTIILEGTQYELIDVQFILPGNTMYDNLTGDLDDFIDVLIQNANRIYPETWVKGLTPTETETKTLSFSERNCLEVLQTLCEEYSTEFEIAVSTTGTRTLHIKQVGVQFPFPFTYGRTGGLYQLTRQNVNSQSVVTRLYVYGGRNNLGNTYRNSKLCLPGKLKNDSYIEDEIAVGLYGVKENTKTFDKIFPARYGTVTSLGEDAFSFHDSSMDFDLNETEEGDPDTTKWLIHGIDAKVRFTTGNLAGYEFDLHKYDHSTKEIQIIPFMDENGQDFPDKKNSAFQIAIGDVYYFTNINLPLAYITEAEEKLETEGEKHYNKYRQPQVQYSLAIHPRFLEKYAGAPEVIPNIFALGDQIQVIDDDIGVNKSLRITGFTRDAMDPYRYTLTLSEAAYNKTIINRIISDIEDITNIIEINNLADPFKARRNWMAAQELLDKIFDPEGYYYSEKIRPLSIETMMLQVGAKSQQFILQNTRFEPNHQGDPNAINIIGGQLVHYTLNDTITTWNLTSTTVTQLDPAKSYFVYAKCERQGGGGVIIVDETQYKVDQDPMFYHFIIGHLSSVITNPDGSNPARILSLTYGSTTINGRFIKTGRIESSGGGSTYFDLDEGIISGNIRFISNGAEVDLSDWADQILAELGDVDGVISDLEEYIDGAFKDGIISEAEAKAIEKYINQINKEKNELEVVYNKTYLNPLLTGTPKTNLLNAKITLFGDITSLLNTINTAIADGATTPAEKLAVDAAFTTYSSSIDLFTTRLEEARISIEQYLKNQSDAIDAKVNTAKAITDKFGTTANGGLINTVMMLLRELNSIQETAGISGIQGTNKDNPAFWAGGTYEKALALIQFLSKMSAGTTPSTGEYEGLAKITMLHNGAAKVGDFIIEESGRIVMIDPATGKPRLMFTVYNLPLIADLTSGTVFSGSTDIGAGFTSTSQILSGSTNVTKDGAWGQFGGTTLTLDAWGRQHPEGMPSYATATLYGRRNGVRVINLGTVGMFFTSIMDENQHESRAINPSGFPSLQSGTYTFELVVETFGDISFVNANSTASTFSWNFTQQDVRYQQYGLDGMMFFYSHHHFHFTEGGGLDGRALPDKWNAPGVLLSATILANGGWNRVWGAKQSPTPPPAPSPTGRYTIYHTIGHTNYQVNCISHTENRSFRVYAKNTNSVVVECRTIGSSPTLSNAMFDITLTGNNY